MTEERKKVPNRLRYTEGRIRGIQEMINEEKECIDVITQLSAIRSSTDRVMGMIVAKNLKHCFRNPEKNPKGQKERLIRAINITIGK